MKIMVTETFFEFINLRMNLFYSKSIFICVKVIVLCAGPIINVVTFQLIDQSLR